MVYENCSELIQFLAIIGGVFIYLLFGYLVAMIFKELFRDEFDRDELTGMMILCIALWPFVIILGLFYVVGCWITVPIWAASRRDVREVEYRLSNKIEEKCSATIDLSDDVEVVAAFKVGDIVTGRIPQTNKYGQNISYDHLYQGCKCRVLSIDRNNSMKVILIDHKDRNAHGDAIGSTFVVPARNFTKVKVSHKKKEVSNKRKSISRSRR